MLLILVSHKYTIAAVQIKGLRFYYCLHLIKPSWVVNLGLLRLLQLSKWELQLEGVEVS